MSLKDLRCTHLQRTIRNQRVLPSGTTMRRDLPWFAKTYQLWMRKSCSTAQLVSQTKTQHSTNTTCLVSTRYSMQSRMLASSIRLLLARPKQLPRLLMLPLVLDLASLALWKSRQVAPVVAVCLRRREKRHKWQATFNLANPVSDSFFTPVNASSRVFNFDHSFLTITES